MLLHTIRAPATEFDIQVKATDEETEAQLFSDFFGPGTGPPRALTLPYLTPSLGRYNCYCDGLFSHCITVPLLLSPQVVR